MLQNVKKMLQMLTNISQLWVFLPQILCTVSWHSNKQWILLAVKFPI